MTEYECGICHKKFPEYEILREHDKLEHPAKDKSVQMNLETCDHKITVPCFKGLDHMNTEEAAGYFSDMCNNCSKCGPEYIITYRRVKDEQERVQESLGYEA